MPVAISDEWPSGPDDEGARYARQVDRSLLRLRADRDARAILAAEGRIVEPFDAGTLAEILARPPEPVARVEGLIPWQASTLLVGQRKTGKTTFVANLARSLLLGEPFLGTMRVRPLSAGARVALLNFEVSAGQLARWAREAGIPDDLLFVVNLRGRRNPLAAPEDRARLSGLLREARAETVIVDPFGRAYAGMSQNDAGEVGAWLVDLDRFVRGEVGALDLVLTAHAGWNGERTRGSSALEDWADVIVTMAKDEDTDARFIRATGRDVELAEDRLDYDPATRRLSLAGVGDRKANAGKRRTEDTEKAIVEALAAHPEGLSGKALAGDRRDADFTRVRDALVARGVIVREARSGRGGGYVYSLNPEGTERAVNVPARTFPNLPNLLTSNGGSGSEGSDAEGTEIPSESLDSFGRCRLHHANPNPSCWTCSRLTTPDNEGTNP